MTKTAEAFAPAGISSFFEICDQKENGERIIDMENAGARGGGFGLCKGVLTQISASESKTGNDINVYINGKLAPEARTTKTVLEIMLAESKTRYDIVVEHRIDVPIGAGFGTSAGGALTAGLALKEALELPLTLNQIGKAAHAAEIQCQTGLGTVSSLTTGGGCVLVIEPGAPGICVIDNIPLTPNYIVIAGVFESVSKANLLSSADRRRQVNRFGRRTMENILANPSLENFLSSCWQFAQDTGFATDRIKNIAHLAKKAGAIGVAQNMVGEAIHAIVREEKAADVEEVFKQVLPKENILVSKIDFQGARLVSNSETIAEGSSRRNV